MDFAATKYVLYRDGWENPTTITKDGEFIELRGKHGHVYHYSLVSPLLGVYTITKRIAKKIGLLEGAVKRQDGDYETVYSVPDKHFDKVARLMQLEVAKSPDETK